MNLLAKKVLFFIILKMAICTLFAQQTVNFPAIFEAQIIASCKQPFHYEKTLHDLSKSSAAPEKQLLSVKEADFLKKELAYTFEFDANDATKKSDFIQIHQQDTLIFTPKSALKSELKGQKILYKNQKISYVESTISKSYWLYTMEMRICVYFDEKGIYKQHFLRMYSKIKGLEAFDNYVLAKKI